MSKGQQIRQAKKTRNDASVDPLLVDIVRLLARAAAERDYIRLCGKDSDGKVSRRQGE
jgi:hypothetical protein